MNRFLVTATVLAASVFLFASATHAQDCSNDSDDPPPPGPAGSFTCEQQLSWGKCNCQWMIGYCKTVCGCGSGQPPCADDGTNHRTAQTQSIGTGDDDHDNDDDNEDDDIDDSQRWTVKQYERWYNIPRTPRRQFKHHFKVSKAKRIEQLEDREEKLENVLEALQHVVDDVVDRVKETRMRRDSVDEDEEDEKSPAKVDRFPFLNEPIA